jgi:hypothetical protein
MRILVAEGDGPLAESLHQRLLQVDSGCDRALIRTIRGAGYQIGGNGRVV